MRPTTLRRPRSSALLAIKPVGAIDRFAARPYGKYPGVEDRRGADKPVIVGAAGTPGYRIEKILKLRPAVSIGTYGVALACNTVLSVAYGNRADPAPADQGRREPTMASDRSPSHDASQVRS